MADLNYIGPVHLVDVESKSGKRLRFRSWAKDYDVGEVTDLRAVRVFPFLTSTSVTLVGGGPEAARGMSATGHEMSWSIEMSYEKWIMMIENYEDCFTVDAKCAIQLGYSGPNGQQLTERFEGIIQTPSISLAEDFVSMSFASVASTWHMSQRDGALVFKNETVFDAIRVIADSHAARLFYLNQSNGEEELKGSVPPSLSNLNRIINEVKQGGDFAVFKELVEINAGYEFYRRNDRIVIYSQKERAAAPVPVFTFRGRSSPKENRYPMLTVSNSNTQTALNPAARVLRYADVDLNTKQTVVEQIKNQDLDIDWQRQNAFSDFVGTGTEAAAILAFTDARGLGDGSFAFSRAIGLAAGGLIDADKLLSGKEVRGDGIKEANKGSFRVDNAGKLLPVASNDPTRKEKALMHKRKAVANSGIRLEWSTPGNPSLLPGMEVFVQGCSRVFDGRYQLHKVTHEVGSDGFVTTLEGVVYGAGDQTNDATESVPYDTAAFEEKLRTASNKLETGALDLFDSKQAEAFDE